MSSYRLHLLFLTLFILSLSLAGSWTMRNADLLNAARQAVEESYLTSAKNQEMATQIERMMASQHAYIMSGAERHATEYADSKARISNLIAELNVLLQSRTAQLSRLNELQHHFLKLSEKLDMMAHNPPERMRTPREVPPLPDPNFIGPQPVRSTFEAIDTARDNILRTSREMLLQENEILAASSKAAKVRREKYNNSLIVSATLLTGMFCLFAIYTLRIQWSRRAIPAGLSDVEEVSRLAIEGSSDGIFEWNFSRNTAFYSRQFWTMLGYESDSLPQTIQSFKELLHPDDIERVENHIERYLSGEAAEYAIIFRLRHKSGRWIWINARGKALYDAAGKPYRIIGAHSDISHIKAYEEKLQKAKEMAEKASRAKTDFLAHMSHEIRTPLTAISGIAEIFQMDQSGLSDKQKQLVRTLYSSTSSLKDLVTDILDFSKIESGELELEERVFPLDPLFEQVVSIMSVKADEKKINFSFDYDAVRGRSFLGDKVRLRQILLNLIGNAIKFTGAGKVEVTARRLGKGKDAALRIDVRDTGIGIDPQHFGLIFERFKQADSSVSRKYGGTGLGLPISMNLARRMGGTITVDSAPGKGSVFTLVVPFRVEDESDDVQDDSLIAAPVLKPAQIIDFSSIENRRILLVEDYEGNIVLLGYLLDTLKCKYDVARTGLEAVNMWHDGKYDLILMDIQMPEMDGFSATAQIRHMEQEKSLPHTPIIGMTAHALMGDREKCLEVGMDAYLPKPIVEADLKARIIEFLSRRRRVA